jgi:hypothetical protein
MTVLRKKGLKLYQIILEKSCLVIGLYTPDDKIRAECADWFAHRKTQ